MLYSVVAIEESTLESESTAYKENISKIQSYEVNLRIMRCHASSVHCDDLSCTFPEIDDVSMKSIKIFQIDKVMSFMLRLNMSFNTSRKYSFRYPISSYSIGWSFRNH